VSQDPPGAVPPGAGDAGREPTEEEIRAYLKQLRDAPADQVVAELLSGMLNAAQVKVGRGDGRMLLDAVAGAIDATRDRLPAELTEQVDDALTKLRLAQVEAEKQVAAGGEEVSDLDTDAGPTAGAEAGASGTEQPGGQRPGGTDQTSRLWIPGR